MQQVNDLGFQSQFTIPVPQDLLDIWAKQLSGAALLVTLRIVRWSLGYLRLTAQLTEEQLCEETGQSIEAVREALTVLENTHGLISVRHLAETGAFECSLVFAKIPYVLRKQQAAKTATTSTSRSTPKSFNSQNAPSKVGSRAHAHGGSLQTKTTQTESKQTPPPPISPSKSRQPIKVGGGDDYVRQYRDASLQHKEVIRALVELDVWKDRHFSILAKNPELTVEAVRQCWDEVCRDDERRNQKFESRQGVLIYRLEAGYKLKTTSWIESDYSSRKACPDAPSPGTRKPLPPMRMPDGRQLNVYDWFLDLKEHLKLKLDDAAFAWIRTAEIVSFSQPDEGALSLVIALGKSHGIGWFTTKLQPRIQFFAQNFFGGAIEITAQA